MTDLDVLLRAVCLDPADDLARLAFADAAEEAGDAARAEFVRTAIRLEQGTVSCSAFMYSCGETLTDGKDRLADCRKLAAHGCAACRRWGEESVKSHYDAMMIPAPVVVDVCLGFSYRCGFISQISLPLAAFMDHAEALFRAHPLTSVTLTDREPDRGDYMKPRFGWWTWDGDDMDPDETWGRHWVPAALRPLLGGVPVRNHWAPGTFHQFDDADAADAARAALSAACVAWGREQAGLPPLTAHCAQSPGG
jgi:uncharacterized protein (TIGR02996 family)